MTASGKFGQSSTLNDVYEKYYNPSEHLAVDEIIVKFKGRVVFRQYIPKKHKRFRIKIFKVCDAAGYTVDMKIYLGRDRTRADKDVTATHGSKHLGFHILCTQPGFKMLKTE
jgi:hypothetical protein